MKQTYWHVSMCGCKHKPPLPRDFKRRCLKQHCNRFKMSAIVTGVLKLTFGFLVNKTRKGIAERLKDGDITDEECRRLFVRELDDIKSKLDGLARKDLQSSLLFLQEGINRLYISLSQSDSNVNAAKSAEEATLDAATSSTDTRSNSVINEAVALVNTMKSLKIRSNDRFKSAIESFKLARVDATKAFGNEALSIEDRIQATQIRMMARILETLEDPDASVNDCLQYLKQLHDIGAIQEIFSVLIDGGVKLRFNKTKRLDIALSVQLMNQILLEFAKEFTKLQPRYLESWPEILPGKEIYCPGEPRLSGKIKKSGVQILSLLLNPDFTFDDKILPWNSAVNSQGDIVAPTLDQRSLKAFKRSGESRSLCEVPWEKHASEYRVTAMDIDAEDNIYIISPFFKSDDELWNFKLLVFDENGNKKLEYLLPFHHSFYNIVSMAINKDKKIAIFENMKKTLYTGKVCLEKNSIMVEKSFSADQLRLAHIVEKVMFADFNGTKIIVATPLHFNIYAESGQLEHSIDIQKKYGHINNSVAINHVMKRILVTMNDSSLRSSLLSFSQTGELIDSSYLGSSKWIRHANLISHLNGPVALVGRTKAAFLKL